MAVGVVESPLSCDASRLLIERWLAIRVPALRRLETLIITVSELAHLNVDTSQLRIIGDPT